MRLFFGSYATDVSIEKREEFERLFWYIELILLLVSC
jgi:hypothetical protein